MVMLKKFMEWKYMFTSAGRNILKDRLEDYKLPEKIFLVEHLEKTISGKIIRHNNFQGEIVR